VEPPKNAMGRNTADSTRAMPTSAPVISPSTCASRRAARALLGHHALDVLDHDDGVVDQQPMASTMANMVSTLIE
jgi:hypothetical protein